LVSPETFSPDFVQSNGTLDGFAVRGASSAMADAEAVKKASARTILIFPLCCVTSSCHFPLRLEPFKKAPPAIRHPSIIETQEIECCPQHEDCCDGVTHRQHDRAQLRSP
jgi:hypothetical protein